jgi:glycosyltransferase involved in cell wall biosynthesis
MKRKVIALISVLKPVDDSRNYHKIGLTLAQTNKYDINIIGFASKNVSGHPRIQYHPILRFSRLSPLRLLAPWKILFLLRRIRPDLLICTTHELLAISVFYRWISGCRLIYDVQENYGYNFLFSGNYPRILRKPLARYVQTLERVLRTRIDLCFLAEHSYALELPFRNYRVIENKTRIPLHTPRNQVPRDHIRFIFAGTIADNYGVFDAVRFVKQVQQAVPGVTLTIAGFCPKSSVLRRLRLDVAGMRGIELVVEEWPMAHERIIRQMQEADFALLPYRLDRSLVHCIPTKMYECIALGLPMLVRPNPYWLALCDRYDSALYTDFDLPEPGLTADLRNRIFYTRGDRQLVRWESAKSQLIAAVDALSG